MVLAPSRETPGLVPGSQARPGNIFFPCWSLGRPSAFDVLVISPLQALTIVEAAQTPGHALQVRVQRKLTNNLSVCRSSGIDFVPLVAEALGGLAFTPSPTSAELSRTDTVPQTCSHLQAPVWPLGSRLVAEQCLPLAPPAPNPSPLPGWLSLTSDLPLCCSEKKKKFPLCAALK